jgi:hypothetical protein
MPVPDSEGCLNEMRDQLRGAHVVSHDLMAMVVASCTRINMPSGAAKAARIGRLVELQAWTEAALALVELELPQWKVRRLICEEGAWLCSLSKQWNLPDWLADSVETCHESLPLAILIAVIEAHRCVEQSPSRVASSVPRCGGEAGSPGEFMCCDNFA